ncbi:flagellin N-terminal helical domain-containing protein [Phycisphaera mikurensis]|uniref:Flagellin n=1 Tax=Phycisphaera mikurensis (strain NBRC 102666 / KCTC 22515 / FYK2301M01) TaxID=1142394 RepID=I0IAM3_PHYMF|nr:flagellin [Phycisphaera mikurensis]MBB6441693.1 flagellin [Phycisphaera mikurensis]BAM02311.1 flagellin [Phycisphaera mikurensis NBRC 102666]
MSRINTNVSSLVARNNLDRSTVDLNTRLERLSTGLRINRGSDDPSGLIASERLRSEIRATDQAVDNAERASNVIATTEGALAEVSSLLTSIKALTIQAANTGAFSPAEIEANQLEIDSAVQSITRISNTASFAGLNLLDGTLGFVTSGVDQTKVNDVFVRAANFGLDSSIPLEVSVLAPAEKASLFLSGGNASFPGGLEESVTIELAGSVGGTTFSFISGTSMADVATAINQVRDATGVSARLENPGTPEDGLIIESTGYGDDAFVSVSVLDGGDSFVTLSSPGAPVAAALGRDRGEDVLATVNGNVAEGKGLGLTLATPTLDVELVLTSGTATTLNDTTEFTITGGGALFQVGPEVNSLQQVGFGIGSIAASRLGNATVGVLSSIATGGGNSLVEGKAREASDIIDAASEQVATLRGRLGAFERNTLDAGARSQQAALENLSAAESSIRDADFAEESAALTRAQILQQANTSTLALANQSAQNVLSLLQ